MDDSRVGREDDKDLVPFLPNNLPPGQFIRSIDTISTSRGRLDPRVENHCSKVHLLPGNSQSSAAFDPADASSGGPVGPLPCCSLKEQNVPGERKSPLHQRR